LWAVAAGCRFPGTGGRGAGRGGSVDVVVVVVVIEGGISFLEVEEE
jgi:hypothetical protein